MPHEPHCPSSSDSRTRRGWDSQLQDASQATSGRDGPIRVPFAWARVEPFLRALQTGPRSTTQHPSLPKQTCGQRLFTVCAQPCPHQAERTQATLSSAPAAASRLQASRAKTAELHLGPPCSAPASASALPSRESRGCLALVLRVLRGSESGGNLGGLPGGSVLH